MLSTPHLAQIRLHPIKSIDGVNVDESRIGLAGGLELDRVWALYSPDGHVTDGKSTAAIQLIRATFGADISSVTLSVSQGGTAMSPETFAFPRDYAAAARWFSKYFAREVIVRYDVNGFPDDTLRSGPMLVSTATLRRVCDWFPEIDLDESRRRFRSPLEIGGVDAFWEDRLFSVLETDAVPFSIGALNMKGSNPCPRCAVPARESQTGINHTGFQKRFEALRRAEYPSWASHPERIKHFYTLGVNTLVAPSEYGKVIRVGDPLLMQ